jgi:hypothetical protein
VTFQIQTVTVNELSTGKNIDLKMEISENKVNTVTGEIPRIVVEQLQTHPFLLFHSTSGLLHSEGILCTL